MGLQMGRTAEVLHCPIYGFLRGNMDKIKSAAAFVKRGYNLLVAQIGIHPGIAFWCIVAYLVVRR